MIYLRTVNSLKAKYLSLMLSLVFIKSQSESLKAFQWVPRFVLHYARYKIFIASIDVWFCHLKTVPVVLYLLSQKLSPPLRFFFS